MRYLIIRDGQPLQEIEQQNIELPFSDAQRIVGGHVEVVLLTHGVVALINEDARVLGMPEHLHAVTFRGYGVQLCGPVLLCGGLDNDDGWIKPMPKDLTVAMEPYYRNPQLRIMAIQP